MKTPYQIAWEKLFEQLPLEKQQTVLSVPDGTESILLAFEAEKLAESLVKNQNLEL